MEKYKKICATIVSFLMLFNIIFFNDWNVQAQDIAFDIHFSNVTRPNEAITVGDTILVHIRVNPNDHLDDFALNLNPVANQYEVDESSIQFSGGNVSIDDGTLYEKELNLGALSRCMDYTLRFQIHFTGSVGIAAENLVINYGYSGRTVDGVAFSATSIAVEPIYAEKPTRVITKTAQNISSKDGKNRIGDIIEYTIQLHNASQLSSVWKNIVLIDYVPEEIKLDYDSILINDIPLTSYNMIGKNVSMNIEEIINGENIIIKLKGEILPTALGKKIINIAQVEELIAKDDGFTVEKPASPAKKEDSNNESKKTSIPTGDQHMITLWVLLLTCSGALIIVLEKSKLMKKWK